MSKLENDINDYVNRIYPEDIIEQSILKDMIFSFVNYGGSKRKRALFEIVKKTDWLDNEKAYNTIKRNVKNLINSEIYHFLRFRISIDSSNNKFLSQLSTNGIIQKQDIIELSDLAHIPVSETIVFIDDVIGTGETIKTCINNYNIRNKCIVIFHSAGQKAINNLQKMDNLILMMNNTVLLETYLTKIDDEYQINLLEDICKRCKKSKYQFGFNESGLMATYEGLCPNNTVSLLWFPDFNKPYEGLIPIFSRKHQMEALHRLRYSIFMDLDVLRSTYLSCSKFINSPNINFIELKVLLALRLHTFDATRIINLTGIDTEDGLISLLQSLKSRELLFVSNNEVDFTDEVYNYIHEIVKDYVRRKSTLQSSML